jgi:predicted lipid-binding transport protein (Tim44 family)
MGATARWTRDDRCIATAATEAEAHQVQAGTVTGMVGVVAGALVVGLSGQLVGVAYTEHTRCVTTTATATLTEGL